MSRWRSWVLARGLLLKTPTDWFTPGRTVVDPTIPYLPLENPVAGGGDTALVVQDCTIGVSAESPALVQGYLLTVADGTVGVSAEAPALLQANLLAVSDATVGVAADSPALVQASLLAVADASVAVSVESPALLQEYLLAVQDATVAVAAESPALVQDWLLAVADATVADGAESPALLQANLLTAADATVALSADSPALEQANVLAVDDSAVAVAVDAPALVQANLLAVEDSAVATVADNVALEVPGSDTALVVQDIMVAVTADDVLLEVGAAVPQPTTPLGFPAWSLAALPPEPVTLAVAGMHVAIAAESPVLASQPATLPMRIAIPLPARIPELVAAALVAVPGALPLASVAGPSTPPEPVLPRHDTRLAVDGIGVAVRVATVMVATIPPAWEPPEPWSLDQEETDLEDILLLVGAMR